jgi:hypothetical protein
VLVVHGEDGLSDLAVMSLEAHQYLESVSVPDPDELLFLVGDDNKAALGGDYPEDLVAMGVELVNLD